MTICKSLVIAIRKILGKSAKFESTIKLLGIDKKE